MPTPHIKRAAFSLVELSIVLVILGLLIGGILSGKSLIRASELRSITTQHSQYVAAVHSFKDKYFGLPGDMPNATQIWGAAHVTPITCWTTASTDAKTCNGNGDGFVYGNGESWRFWQQLANANLIEGSYSGVGSPSYCSSCAPAKIAKGYWFPFNFDVVTGGSANFGVAFNGEYKNSFLLGDIYYSMVENTRAVLSPQEMWNIDSKMDDGKPATGKVVAMASYTDALSACTDATGTTAVQGATLTASYLLTTDDKKCSIIFRQQF